MNNQQTTNPLYPEVVTPSYVVKMELIAQLPNGYAPYREPNEVGGFRYWSDEVGGGVRVWDTSLVDESTLLAALTEDARRIHEEDRRKQAK